MQESRRILRDPKSSRQSVAQPNARYRGASLGKTKLKVNEIIKAQRERRTPAGKAWVSDGGLLLKLDSKDAVNQRYSMRNPWAAQSLASRWMVALRFDLKKDVARAIRRDCAATRAAEVSRVTCAPASIRQAGSVQFPSS